MPLTRRRFLTARGAATATLASPLAFAASATPSRQKGWAGGGAGRHKQFGAHRYYNWTPNRGNSDREFVPMIKGAWNVGEKVFNKIRGDAGITHLLGYDFLKDALRFLERSRTVERYAYFDPGAGKPHSLLKKDGTLTPLGELSRAAGA